MSISNQQTKQQLRNPPFNPLNEILTAEDSRSEPAGAAAVSGPTASIVSGFWLRVEGMVGMDDPDGEAAAPPGEGRRGAMSGDNSVYGGSGGSGRTAGAAEIVGVGGLIW